MKVVIKNSVSQEFGDLKTGDCFISLREADCKKDIWIKCSREPCGAVCLNDGMMGLFDLSDPIEIVNPILTVE